MEKHSKEKIEAMSNLLKGVSDVIASQIDVLDIKVILSSVMFVVFEAVFHSAHDEISAHKFINSVLVAAKKYYPALKELHGREED